jgi:heavy metal efflux system protein
MAPARAEPSRASPLPAPRVRLRDLVSPFGADGQPDPQGQFLRAGAAAIYREQGKRFIAVRFQVRGRDHAPVVDEARKKLSALIRSPYRAEWTGE